jgi:large-conductance mechanosensitive channel
VILGAPSEDQVTPGVLGFLIVVALGVALFLLVRSMNKQIRKIEAPSEEELKQAEWERKQQESAPSSNGNGGSQQS